MVMAETRIRKLEEAFDEFDRPQAIRDALKIAETEKELLLRMKETDPDLLKNDTQGIIDVERIRSTYYSVIQNKHDKEAQLNLKPMFDEHGKLLRNKEGRV